MIHKEHNKCTNSGNGELRQPDSDTWRQRRVALVTEGHTKHYLGRYFTADLVDNLTDADIEKLYTRYETRLEATMTKLPQQFSSKQPWQVCSTNTSGKWTESGCWPRNTPAKLCYVRAIPHVWYAYNTINNVLSFWTRMSEYHNWRSRTKISTPKLERVTRNYQPDTDCGNDRRTITKTRSKTDRGWS